MVILVSELYGKRIITNGGQVIGMVEDVIIDFEAGSISSLLLTKMEELVRSQNTAGMLKKNSIRYDRVKSVAESIIITTAASPK
jgi:sporulation protein YlmC with PRC-barrel domain